MSLIRRNEDLESLQLIRKCQNRVKNYFNNGFEYNALPIPRSNDFLRKHDSEKMPMFVLYVDLIGSTKMSFELSPDALSIIIRSFCQEMAGVIEHYDGHVLKFVGDAAIGYFVDQNNSPSIANESVNCAISMINVIKNGMNPILQEKNFPQLDVKITVDFGVGSIIRYSKDKKKAHIDIIGLALNRAAKMQNIVKSNHIIIGGHVFDRITPQLRNSFEEIHVDENKWNYIDSSSGKLYPLYSITSNSS